MRARARNAAWFASCLMAALAVVLGAMAAPAWAAVRPPRVTSVAPASGSSAGGRHVVIHGRNVDNVERVYFGRVRARWVAVVSRSELEVIAPPHTPGPVNVRVVNPAGRSPVVSADRFRYVAPPRVSAVSPKGGDFAGGLRVTVSGSGFRRGADVDFGAVAATGVRVLSADRLTVLVPPHAAGVVHVRVRTAYGGSPTVRSDEFTYRASFPSAVSELRVARTHTSITLSWTDPVDPHFHGVRVLRSAGDQIPSPGSGTVVADVGVSTTTITDGGLAPGATYTYALYSYDLEPYFSEGVVRTVTTQADAGIQWAAPTVVSPTAGLTSISCPTDTFCAALDTQGNARTFDGTTWSAPTPARAASTSWFVGISCASPTFCAAPDGAGRAVTFDGVSWSAPATVDPDPTPRVWRDLSCAAPAFCLGVLAGGDVVVFDGTTWSAPQSVGIDVVSCTSATFCLGVSATGTYRTFDGVGWSAPAAITTTPAFCPSGCGGYVGVSCSTASFCVVASDGGTPVATYDGTGWSMPSAATATTYLIRASCSTAATCVVYTGGGSPASSFNGGEWSPPVQPDVNDAFSDIACAPSFCLATAGSEVVRGTWP